jgi:hypothetical protein
MAAGDTINCTVCGEPIRGAYEMAGFRVDPGGMFAHGRCVGTDVAVRVEKVACVRIEVTEARD